MRKVFAVFSGGGVKGAAFVGAVEEAQKYVQFAGWGGTSAGSIIAALLACGYSTEELRTRLYAAPYGNFFRISLNRVLRFNHFRSLIDPAPLLAWLREHISVKFPKLHRVTFNDLRDDQHLKIVAANISTREIVIYSKRTSPNVEIARAVLASCSLPLFFPAVTDGEDEVLDGGIFSNFPMWLFYDDEETQKVVAPVLGFSLVSAVNRKPQKSVVSYAYSIVESVLAAQDRVQDKYIDASRSATVIRISVEDVPTFTTSKSRQQQQSLILAGKDAASRYFDRATKDYGTPVLVPAIPPGNPSVQDLVAAGKFQEAVSAIARQHIFHGGVARDSGQFGERVIVKYYIDLMEAATDHDKLDVLAEILANRIRSIGHTFDRIVGIKKGNIILAYAVSQKLRKPLSVYKSDMSYKMGQPFDGTLKSGERVIVVDDFASDARMLLTPIRYLNFYNTVVLGVVTLLERLEGDARPRFWEKNVSLYTVCSIDDNAIERLITRNETFHCNELAAAPTESSWHGY